MVLNAEHFLLTFCGNIAKNGPFFSFMAWQGKNEKRKIFQVNLLVIGCQVFAFVTLERVQTLAVAFELEDLLRFQAGTVCV